MSVFMPVSFSVSMSICMSVSISSVSISVSVSLSVSEKSAMFRHVHGSPPINWRCKDLPQQLLFSEDFKMSGLKGLSSEL
jgi:hypothetical protein